MLSNSVSTSVMGSEKDEFRSYERKKGGRKKKRERGREGREREREREK